MSTTTTFLPLNKFFQMRLRECVYADELSARLEAEKLDCWDNLDNKIRSLGQRQWNTPEKVVESLFAAENADEFMELLLA